MNRVTIVFLGFAGLIAFWGSPVHAAPSAKVTARVVDENGTPIQGANVTAGYTLAGKIGVGTDNYRAKGKSNKDGLFTATGETIIPQVTIHAEYDGYYRSSKWAKFPTRNKLLNRWQPWNPTVEVVLKKKRNPVAMYMKGTNWIEVPTEEEPVGFDLEKGDWVNPYGSGNTSDFIFRFKSDIRAYREYDIEMVLNFSNELDGIQEYFFNPDEQSDYKWPFDAQVDGFQKELVKKIHKIPGKTNTNINRDEKYIFRVRTKTDAQGNLISARYGKISSEFELSPEGSKCVLRFFYYFNPDGTRNLEEDPKQNLFKKK